MFRGPDFVSGLLLQAFSSMDFTGKGKISEEEFMKSLVVQRLRFDPKDVQAMLHREDYFEKGKKQPQMDYDLFKKSFFPQLFHQQDIDKDSDDEVQKLKDYKRNSKKENRAIIETRMLKLERLIKEKFANNWVSVRKAFLDLDTDYDGYVTVEDIMRHFTTDSSGFEFKDLKKLIHDKDSRRVGRISYADFSKWMGGTIHQSEGFFFRHDSIKNTQFERNLSAYNQRQERNRSSIVTKQIGDMDIYQTVLEKIKFQWKTLKKAFIDLNQDKSGAIVKSELRHYLNHWGLTLNEQQFGQLFDRFDSDKDGKISYKDFQLTVGSEIAPAESLYFRQDKPRVPKADSCKHENCWANSAGWSEFCQVHVKMFKEKAT